MRHERQHRHRERPPRQPPPPARQPRPERPAGPAENEVRVCGLNASLAVFDRRRDDIIRVYVTEARMKACGALLRWCAETRRAYHVVGDEELQRVTQSTHHEGVCLLVRQLPVPDLAAFCTREKTAPAPRCVLLLDDVSNPHNLGAIVRVGAHFGAAGILLVGEPGTVPTLSAAVYRTAEGGLEHVPVIPVGDAAAAVRLLRDAGFTIMATSSHTRDSLYDGALPPKVVFLLGSETAGLSDEVLRLAERRLAIPGSGAVESLNVACAAAVLLGEFWRGRGPRP